VMAIAMLLGRTGTLAAKRRAALAGKGSAVGAARSPQAVR